MNGIVMTQPENDLFVILQCAYVINQVVNENNVKTLGLFDEVLQRTVTVHVCPNKLNHTNLTQTGRASRGRRDNTGKGQQREMEKPVDGRRGKAVI